MKKVSLNIADKPYATLEYLSKKLSMDIPTLMSHMLRLYETAYLNYKAGGKIIIETSDGTLKELLVFNKLDD